MTQKLEKMLGARLEEIANMAADAIAEATGDESALQVETFRQFKAGESYMASGDLYHLLRTAEHLYGGKHRDLSVKLLRYSRVAQRTR